MQQPKLLQIPKITEFMNMMQNEMDEEESQHNVPYIRTSFDPSDMRLKIKTLTHDYYVLQLPENKANEFYQYFPFYLEQRDFRGKLINFAPVARIYGTNEFGQKCCCHVHGYFPQFYIKADEYADAFTNDRQFVKKFLTLLQGLYQRAYTINRPIIVDASVQQKMDFYGYHQNPQTFLKITVYDPSYVVKLRELLDSKILGGRSFQCYEAHINYFMQLFSDHNIYGINQLTVIQFSFRKNLKNDLMDLFKKINTKTKKLFDVGYNVTQIEKNHPKLFNTLQKISSCYIEIDFYINNILNTFAPQHQIINSDQEKSINSQVQVEPPNLGDYRRKFQVKITRALQQIWEDQKKRRQNYGIQAKPEGVLDMSQNIQGKNAILNQNKDPMWINFVKKGNNAETLMEMIRSFQRGQTKKQSNQLQIQRYVAQNYSEVLSKEREKLIQKVKARWKFYGIRKVNYLQQILKGERQELPEWDDDKNYEQDQSSSEGQQKQEKDESEREISISKSDNKSDSSKTKSNNVALYRGNYKHQKAQLSKQSYFYICQTCKQTKNRCKCVQNKCDVESTNDETVKQQQSQSFQTRKESQNLRAVYKYQIPPPSIDEVVQSSVVSTQKPYYSDFQDLFEYHKINPVFSPCLKTAQILDQQLKIIKQLNRQPITIQNQDKLPYYYRHDLLFDIEESEQDYYNKPLLQTTYKIKYEIAPPSFQAVDQQFKKKNQSKSKRRSTSIKASKQDTFVSDLVVFHYQFLVGFQKNCPRYCADPEKDQIIAFSFQVRNFQQYRKPFRSMILIEKYVSKQSLQVWLYQDIYFVKNEYDLLSMVISIICRVDPDFLVTYDQQKRGIRYLTQRGFAHGINLPGLISRSCDLDELFQFINFKNFVIVKQQFLTKQVLLKGNLLQNKQKHKSSPHLAFLQQKLKKSLKRKPVLRQKYSFDIQIKGRVNVSLYRICQAQLKLKSYSIQNVCRHLFNQQISEFTQKDLFNYYCGIVEEQQNQDYQLEQKILSKTKKLTRQDGINFVLEYITKRLELQAQIVTNLNMITVLIEKSKIYGSDIVSMMERGSQFKIEAIMCRVTKKLGYLTLSASKRQVGNQSVLQCVPLVLQPPKQFFSQPVLLFDFQSLYPSVMIAYNICYSTCLGSINTLFDKNKQKKIGVSERMNIDITFLGQILKKTDLEQIKEKLDKSVFITPNKVAFVKKSVREGILPRILLQFLISRIMIKKSQGLYKKSKIRKILKDRQYALKLFMNVMFGYSGASFSGRMPCSEIADSIVQISKYLLRQSIQYLNTHNKYKGKVLYGDTDSIFFQMPGYSINQSIKIGKQLAKQMTGLFPYPIQMKFEKVYDGLFLVAKKRYYGKMYESETSGPKYEGKGLECVRRDGINLTSQLMKQMLDSLIDTRNLTTLKKKFKQECQQILNNQKPESQFWLAKQVKLLKYSDKHCPGHGEAAKRLQKIDPMLVPKYGERMKYFVINGGLRPIRNRSISVFEYVKNRNMTLDLDYYFRKQVVPPLQRVLSSLADLNEWTSVMEFRSKIQVNQDNQYQAHEKCLHCHGNTDFILCYDCFEFGDQEIIKTIQIRKQSITVCKQCTGCEQIASVNKCVQYNCEQLWQRRTVEKNTKMAYQEIIQLQQAIKQFNL